MNRDCNDIQTTIVELGGDLAALDDSCRRHLETCDACRRRAAEEAALARALRAAAPPADPHLQMRIITVLAGVSARRRWLAAAPVAASLFLVLLGLKALGGVPGGGLAAGLATWSGGSWLLLVDSLGESLAALATVARIVAEVVPLPVGLAAVAASMFGLAAVTVLTRRWKHVPA